MDSAIDWPPSSSIALSLVQNTISANCPKSTHKNACAKVGGSEQSAAYEKKLSLHLHAEEYAHSRRGSRGRQLTKHHYSMQSSEQNKLKSEFCPKCREFHLTSRALNMDGITDSERIRAS